MKKLTSFFLVALLSVSTAFAADDAFVANWQFPIDGWFAGAAAPAVGIEAYPRTVAEANMVTGFDAATADFDAAWANAGTAFNLGGAAGNRLGLAASDNGAADFTGSFKALYDDNNMYILVQWTDDDVTGNESAEICLSPYFKLDAADRPDAVGGEWYHTSTAWYTRFSQFGANKLSFKKTGFDAAMMVNFSEAGVGSINWGGTTPTLTNNLFVDDKTAPASKTVKWIITIGYPVLTGSQRPEFNKTIWAGLNGGKGVSFDLKINDVDADDALNADATPVQKPAEYWFSTTSNDAWQSNMYAGFLALKAPAVSDDAIVANWQFPIDGWFAGAASPAVGIEAYPRTVANASEVMTFDPATADFDAAWATGTAFTLGGTAGNRLGLAASDNGAADFTGSFKALYDDNNMYILVKWTDDDVTGNESAEICLSPYFKLNAVDRPDAVGGEWYHTSNAWYTRYSQFGANKLTFKKTGFDAAMMVNFSEAGAGSINWGGTTPTLTNNLFVDDKTAPASKTVKWIITVGYPVLTGVHRPEFNKTIWAGLNGGKGVSFDLKINDVDADDALNADATPVQKPAEYWFSTTSNDAWQSNIYAGFLAAAGGSTAVNVVKMVNFAKITANHIELNTPADVAVYNATGKLVINVKNTSTVNISNLSKGAYILRSNNQSQKFVR